MLTTTLIILLTSFCTAALTRFIDMCFDEGMILHGYFKWLERITNVRKGNAVNEESRELEPFVVSSDWLYKPLGGCIYCMGFWLCVPACVFVCYALSMPALWCFFVFWSMQSLNFFFIELQEKILS